MAFSLMKVVVLVDIFLSLLSNLCLCHRNCWIAQETSGCLRDNIAGDQIQKTIYWDKGPNQAQFFCNFCEISSA